VIQVGEEQQKVHGTVPEDVTEFDDSNLAHPVAAHGRTAEQDAELARERAKGPAKEASKKELVERAKELGIEGASRMTKDELTDALSGGGAAPDDNAGGDGAGAKEE
jgi:hypothetical protein